MRIVVFGAGKFYQKRKEELLSDIDVELVAIIDNNQYIQGTYMDHVPILGIEQLEALDYDIVILMSAKASEMKIQLSKLGVDPKRIWYWERFKSEKEKGRFYFHCGDLTHRSWKKKVLFISNDLGYSGGALAAVYAALALQERHYKVVLAAPGGNSVFIKEIKERGLNIMICPALPYLYEEELAFIEQFDAVIVNVFPMILCASEISKRKPVVWWIHEASDFYQTTRVQFAEYAREEQLENIDIYAVSRIAQANFNHYFPKRISQTLAYGIPDECLNIPQTNKGDKILFAIIGGVTPRKAQDIFLEAVKGIKEELRKKALFWIIGSLAQDSYCNKIRDMASDDSSIIFWGEMPRVEIEKAFFSIDVLVCPSWEDPLPIVATEAMMYGRPCIVSESIGTVDYIMEGRNGLIFPTGDSKALSAKMEWVIQNSEQLSQMGKNARQTYEKYFTMDGFGERLEAALQNSLKNRP
ncbi:MAG: glycosyltransferase [Lachnospiraceae bacterium]|nr:glycosyltransferase [Lachnospiraceae bacterium]